MRKGLNELNIFVIFILIEKRMIVCIFGFLVKKVIFVFL